MPPPPRLSVLSPCPCHIRTGCQGTLVLAGSLLGTLGSRLCPSGLLVCAVGWTLPPQGSAGARASVSGWFLLQELLAPAPPHTRLAAWGGEWGFQGGSAVPRLGCAAVSTQVRPRGWGSALHPSPFPSPSPRLGRCPRP